MLKGPVDELRGSVGDEQEHHSLADGCEQPQRSAFSHEATLMGQEYVPRVPFWIVVEELRVLEGVGLLGVAMDESLALLLRGGPGQLAFAL